MLFTPSKASNPMTENANVAPTRSPIGAATPEPSSSPKTRQKLAYVELHTLSAEEKSLYATDLSERPISYEEAFPEHAIGGIIGELEVDKEQFYFVKLSDGQAFRVRLICLRLSTPRRYIYLFSSPFRISLSGIQVWSRSTVSQMHDRRHLNDVIWI